MIGWWERWDAWLKNREGKSASPGIGGAPTKRAPAWGKDGRFSRSLVLLGVCGVALMVIGNIGGRSVKDAASPPPTAVAEPVPLDEEGAFARRLEDRLEQMINRISGVSDAEVLITMDTGSEKVFAQQVETDRRVTKQGADAAQLGSEDRTTSQPVTVTSGGQEVPIVRYVRQPEVRGVLVVADGAESPAIRLAITDAVATALHLPAYRVAVYARGAM